MSQIDIIVFTVITLSTSASSSSYSHINIHIHRSSIPSLCKIIRISTLICITDYPILVIIVISVILTSSFPLSFTLCLHRHPLHSYIPHSCSLASNQTFRVHHTPHPFLHHRHHVFIFSSSRASSSSKCVIIVVRRSRLVTVVLIVGIAVVCSFTHLFHLDSSNCV